jgi:hypothetical protein
MDGGTVMIGASTSNYGVRKFAAFIEYIYAEGTSRDVPWSEKSEDTRRMYGADALNRRSAA